MLELPAASTLNDVNDVQPEDFPRFAYAEREREPPVVTDIPARVADALDAIPALDGLEPGATVGITAGSRGIHDIPEVLAALVAALDDRGLDPFVLPAMGSHGGATAAGQREMLETLGLTEDWLGCEIRSSMAVEQVATDDRGRPIYVSETALEADAVLLANRVKAHTDFNGEIESGLCKMAVIGLGKQRGANAAHNAAMQTGFQEVIPEWAAAIVEHAPVVGGVALIENANERVAVIEGVPAGDVVSRAPDLLDRANELLPTLPVDELDLLILDEVGKNISGTGMDTNVVGRMLMHGEPEPDSPRITRIYVRSLTEEAHGNANGIGLADFAHRRAVEDVTLADTYLNCITGAQPERGRLPVVVPTDLTAMTFAYSTTGVSNPRDLRVARIRNTLEPDHLVVSEAVAADLRDRDDFTVSESRPLAFTDGDFAAGRWPLDAE